MQHVLVNGTIIQDYPPKNQASALDKDDSHTCFQHNSSKTGHPDQHSSDLNVIDQ